MNIGQFKSINGQLLGSIATATITLGRLGLRSVQSSHERAPKYEVVTLNGRIWVQIGALWEAKARETGEFFLQGSVDDPSFSAPLQIALFGDAEEGYRVAWTRNRRRNTGFGAAEGGDSMAPMGEGDAFEGNADDEGGLMEGSEGQEQPEQSSTRRRRGQQQSEEVPAFA